MSFTYPIEISSQEQDDKILKIVKENQQKQKLLTVQMSNHQDQILFLMQSGVQGTEQEKQKKVKQKINEQFNEKFQNGGEFFNLAKDHFNARMEVPQIKSEDGINQREIILYGVDLLSQKKIRERFPKLSPKIKWINVSTCKVSFQQPEQTMKAIELNQIPQEMEEQKGPLAWIELYPYCQLGFERRLWMRYALKSQQNIQTQKSNTYKSYLKAKESLMNELWKDYRDSWKNYEKKYPDIFQKTIRPTQRFNRPIRKPGRPFRRDGQFNDYEDREGFGNRFGGRNRERQEYGNRHRGGNHERNEGLGGWRKQIRRRPSFSSKSSHSQDIQNLSYEIQAKQNENESMLQDKNLSFVSKQNPPELERRDPNLSFQQVPQQNQNPSSSFLNTSFNYQQNQGIQPIQQPFNTSFSYRAYEEDQNYKSEIIEIDD